ncbi:MAG: hypothetical protein WAU61_06005 [Smithella sp.]
MKKTSPAYFFLKLAVLLTAIIGCSSHATVPPQSTIYDAGVSVDAVTYSQSATITLYQDTGSGYVQIFNGSVVAGNASAKLGVQVSGGAFTGGRVFLSDGLTYQVEATLQNGLYVCDYSIGSQLLVPILVQVIYSNNLASKEKFVLRTYAGAPDNQLVRDGVDIFIGKNILATAQGITYNGYTIDTLAPSQLSFRSSPQNAVLYTEVTDSLSNIIDTDYAVYDGIADGTTASVDPSLALSFITGIPQMNVGTVSETLSDVFGSTAYYIDGYLTGLNLNLKTAYLDIHGLPNATSDDFTAVDIGVLISANALVFPSGITLYPNNAVTHPALNLTPADVQLMFGTNSDDVLAQSVGLNISMDNLTQIVKNLLNGSVTLDFSTLPLSLILPSSDTGATGVDQKLRFTFNPEGIAFDFRTSTPLLILDDVRIEYLENDVPKWMMSMDMTLSLAISTHNDSGESYLDVNITLVPGSARCHVMKDEQGIGLFDHSNFVQSFVAALAGLLPSNAGADLMFSINMEDYGLALIEVAGTSGAGRYFINLVTTQSDLTKILKHVHTGN